MDPLTCFLIEPTARVRALLQTHTYWPVACPQQPNHVCATARVPLREGQAPVGIEGTDLIAWGNPEIEAALGITRDVLDWPTQCAACARSIPPAEAHHRLVLERQWRRADDRTPLFWGEPCRHAPAGAFYRAPWQQDDDCRSQDDEPAPLVVMIPGSGGFLLDGCDARQSTLHHWQRVGIVPHITVVQSHGQPDGLLIVMVLRDGEQATWRGYLRDGVLTEAPAAT